MLLKTGSKAIGAYLRRNIEADNNAEREGQIFQDIKGLKEVRIAYNPTIILAGTRYAVYR